MLEYSLLFLAAVTVFAVLDWRNGLYLCTVMALAQDVLRKLTPGEPGYFVLFSGIVFAGAVLGLLMQGKSMRPTVIEGWKKHLGTPFKLYVILVLLQAVHSFLRFGSVQVTAIGLINYLAPVLAVVFAYRLAVYRGLGGLRRWVLFYVGVAGIGLSGVYLEYLGYDWQALGEVGTGLIIYDVGTVLKAYSGFFRSSEIAAWHTSAVACFLFLWVLGKKMTFSRLLIAVILIALVAGLGTLTGRRKLLVVITIFVAAYFFVQFWFQKRSVRPALMALGLGVIGYVLVIGLVDTGEELSYTRQMSLDPQERYQYYTVRAGSVFESLPQRFSRMGVKPIEWAVSRYGIFGAGLGTGSQGVQHVAGFSLNRGAAESGLGKVTMELGIPGLLLVVWLLWALVRYVRNALLIVTRLSYPHARMAYAMVAFLMANTAAFSVATQAFGDTFVLFMVGWALGIMLAMPVVAVRDLEHAQTLGRAQGASIHGAVTVRMSQ